MATYDDLKVELLEIAKIVEKFPENVKVDVFNVLIGEYTGTKINTITKDSHIKQTPKKNTIDKGTSDKPQKITKKKNSLGESYKLDKDLNLRGDTKVQSFSDFFEEKKPSNSMEFNAVAVYYLCKILEIQNITLDHAYTCYREVNKKSPKAFRQSFLDTKKLKGWINMTSDSQLEIPHRGVVFVDSDLPRV